MLRYATLLQEEIKRLGHTVRLLQPKPFVGKLCPGRTGLGKWLGYADKFLLFPHLLRSTKNDFDIVHICDHSNAIYTKFLKNVPHVVTCHDMLAVRSALGEIPENPVSLTGQKLQQMIASGLKQA